MPRALADDWMAASFFWGLLKSLIPLPSPSGFTIISAEVVRTGASAGTTTAKLLLEVVLPGAAGLALGTTPYYLWARAAGIDAVARWGPALGIKKKRILDLESRAAHRRAPIVWGLFAFPLSPCLLAGSAAGVLDLDPGTYAWIAYSGACARCALLAGVGWMFRTRFGEPGRFLRPADAAAAAVAGFLALLLVLRRRRAAIATRRDAAP